MNETATLWLTEGVRFLLTCALIAIAGVILLVLS